jgi:hypothetical protein
MKMPFRVQDNVPEIYVNESRDFQLLCRLYDCIINGVKFDIDSMKFLTDTKNCNSRVLDLLKSKVGFYNDKYIFSDDMRKVLEAFPHIIKYKGSKEAVLQTVCLFMKVNRVRSDCKIDFDNDKREIRIGIKSPVSNYIVIDEIMKYILPTGYTYYCYSYKSPDNTNIKVNYQQKLYLLQTSYDGYIITKKSDGSYVIEAETKVAADRLGRIGATTLYREITEETTENKGDE